MSITLALSWLGHDIPEKTLQTYEITVMNSCEVFFVCFVFVFHNAGPSWYGGSEFQKRWTNYYAVDV